MNIKIALIEFSYDFFMDFQFKTSGLSSLRWSGNLLEMIY